MLITNLKRPTVLLPSLKSFSSIINPQGAFVRPNSSFRDHIEKGGKFSPDQSRYHLYVSNACPWAHRTMIVREIKGLQSVIGLTVVAPTFGKTKPDDHSDEHFGWLFKDENSPPYANPHGVGSFSSEGSNLDQVNHKSNIREIYEMVEQKADRFSVPILWDKKLKTIVNNDSGQIAQMLSEQFNESCEHPQIKLMPQHLQNKMEEVNGWVLPHINNGVYKAGFAQKQQPYDQAVQDLFRHLDKAEQVLRQSRFLCGQKITLSDIRLFTTLIRFDQVYATYFKCNKRLISQYHNLFNFVKDMYQTQGIGCTVNMSHIKQHYYTSHPLLNHYAIIPRGPDVESEVKKPHDRDQNFPLQDSKFYCSD